MKSEADKSKFEFLRDLALELGATEAKIIPANEVVVENRVVLKCRVGCKHFGKTLMCPPYTISVDEFRKTLNEYSYALVFKIKSQAEATAEVAQLLSKNENDPSLTKENKEKIQDFWASWKAEKKQLVKNVCLLERAAMNRGYTLALGFTTGSCTICDECNIEERICNHPT